MKIVETIEQIIKKLKCFTRKNKIFLLAIILENVQSRYG
jgi:hypothetical protein